MTGKLIIQCPQCGSKQVMAKTTGESWCRKCGWKGKTEETIDKPKKEEGK